MVKGRLILVEGIPGAGKTTTANKIKDELSGRGINVRLFEEGMSHPADMAWQAYLSEEEYKEFLDKCYDIWENSDKCVSKLELKNLIEKQVRREDNHIILAYTKIEFPEVDYWRIIDSVASKEICDGRRSLSEFKKIHLKRWSEFAKVARTEDVTYIFECAFLQNHIFELMGVYEKSQEEILEYLRELIDTVSELKPSITYIKPKNVRKVIMNASDERKAIDSSRKDWIDEIGEWVSSMNYGKSHNLKGVEGVVKFCEERLRIDEYVLNNLGIPVNYIFRE